MDDSQKVSLLCGRTIGRRYIEERTSTLEKLHSDKRT